MFELFKLLEMFDGKIILSANELSPDEIAYLVEFKMDLNRQIALETQARQEAMGFGSSAPQTGKEAERAQYDKIFGHVKKRQGKS